MLLMVMVDWALIIDLGKDVAKVDVLTVLYTVCWKRNARYDIYSKGNPIFNLNLSVNVHIAI